MITLFFSSPYLYVIGIVCQPSMELFLKLLTDYGQMLAGNIKVLV